MSVIEFLLGQLTSSLQALKQSMDKTKCLILFVWESVLVWIHHNGMFSEVSQM